MGNYNILSIAGVDCGAVGMGPVDLNEASNAYYEALRCGRPISADSIPAHEIYNKRRGIAMDFIPGFLDFAPYVADRVIASLPGQLCQFLSIGSVFGREYFVMNVLAIVDCLDFEQSRYKVGRDGQIESATELYLKSDIETDALLFRIKGASQYIVASEGFIEIVRRRGLTGVGFRGWGLSATSFNINAIAGLPLLDKPRAKLKK